MVLLLGKKKLKPGGALIRVVLLLGKTTKNPSVALIRVKKDEKYVKKEQKKQTYQMDKNANFPFSCMVADGGPNLWKKQKPVEHQYPFFFYILAVAKMGWTAALGTDEGARPPTGICSAPSMMGGRNTLTE